MTTVTCRFCETQMEVKRLRRHWLNDCPNVPKLEPDERLCSTCQTPRSATLDFSKRTESPDGLQNACKDCSISRAKEWRSDNSGGSAKLPDFGIGQIQLRPGRWKLKPCKYCGKEFNWTGMHVHLRSCDKHPRNRTRKPVNPNLPDMAEVLKRYQSQTLTERAKSNSLQYHYGINIDDYNRMLAEQNGVCAICGLPPSGKRDSRTIHLCVDHCHATQKVRSLLCSTCNAGIGGMKDDPELFDKAKAYVIHWKSVHAAEVHDSPNSPSQPGPEHPPQPPRSVQ